MSNAHGSSASSRPERRSKEQRGNSISTIMHYGATGLIMCARVPRRIHCRRRCDQDQLEAIVADESLALVDYYRITRSGLYRAFSAACEAGDGSGWRCLPVGCMKTFAIVVD
jgi:hypothetical protein